MDQRQAECIGDVLLVERQAQTVRLDQIGALGTFVQVDQRHGDAFAGRAPAHRYQVLVDDPFFVDLSQVMSKPRAGWLRYRPSKRSDGKMHRAASVRGSTL